MKVAGKLVDIHQKRIYPAIISIEKDKITSIKENEYNEQVFILPGFIDAHVHIESSMLTPGSFAMASVPHGTIGTVSDPHEIANIIGMDGVNFMIEDGKKTPFRFYFGAPSCVPATDMESSGARLGSKEIETLMNSVDIRYLAEMMNFPGVINGSEEVIEKISIAKKHNKPVDGHAPGLSGEALRKYIEAGISTDHECSSIEEAIEKINLGMKVIIREGSAGRNLNALKGLYALYPEMIMLGSDDIHPEMLQKRHLEKLVAELVEEGYDLFNVLRSVTMNPVFHYGLDAGLLRPGNPADFIVVDDIRKMNVLETWINGVKVYDRGKVLFEYKPSGPVNKFNCSPISTTDIEIMNRGHEMKVIAAFDGELFTKEIIHETGSETVISSDIENDLLKIIVKDRYQDSKPAVGFIKGFGLKSGAFASSVAHDSHNIIAIGTNDEDIVAAVNEIVKMKGGLTVSSSGRVNSLQLDIAGIMSTKSCPEIASEYENLSEIVKKLGCTMSAPFMTLSFMALLVIPELKLSDRGLFDGIRFKHVPMFI